MSLKQQLVPNEYLLLALGPRRPLGFQPFLQGYTSDHKTRQGLALALGRQGSEGHSYWAWGGLFTYPLPARSC